MHTMVDRPPSTAVKVNCGGASNISDTCEDGSSASATETDDETEADDIDNTTLPGQHDLTNRWNYQAGTVTSCLNGTTKMTIIRTS